MSPDVSPDVSPDPGSTRPGLYRRWWQLRSRAASHRRRQLLSINLLHAAGTLEFMGHDVRMQGHRADRLAGPASSPATSPDADGAAYLYPRVTSFRSRRSTLSDAQHRTWERRWPELGRQSRGERGPAGRLDTREWFGREAPVVLEIGCGTGTSTLAMAQDEPDVDVVAADVYKRGLAQLLSAIDRQNICNIRLIRGDGSDVLEYMFGADSLTGVRVYFPDPWPKSRHHKRRLLQPPTIALIADRLRPGGVLHVATDHAGYAEQIAEAGDAEPMLRRVDSNTPGLPLSVLRPTTKYETKAQQAGSTIAELLWEKRRL